MTNGNGKPKKMVMVLCVFWMQAANHCYKWHIIHSDTFLCLIANKKTMKLNQSLHRKQHGCQREVGFLPCYFHTSDSTYHCFSSSFSLLGKAPRIPQKKLMAGKITIKKPISKFWLQTPQNVEQNNDQYSLPSGDNRSILVLNDV